MSIELLDVFCYNSVRGGSMGRIGWFSPFGKGLGLPEILTFIYVYVCHSVSFIRDLLTSCSKSFEKQTCCRFSSYNMFFSYDVSLVFP